MNSEIHYQGSRVGSIDPNGKLVEGNLLLRELFAAIDILGLAYYEGVVEEADDQITEGALVTQEVNFETISEYLQTLGFRVVKATSEELA